MSADICVLDEVDATRADAALLEQSSADGDVPSVEQKGR